MDAQDPRIDNRLLSVFDAIYRTRSVSLAAAELGLGQPAVSVALSKMRQRFGDALFVRTANGMEPTPLGAGLVRPVRDVLDALDVVTGQRMVFDPVSSQRTFRICMADISQLVFLPRLWARLRAAAPLIRIEVLPLSDRCAAMLEQGEADLAIGFLPQLEAGFHQNVLFSQSFVCLVSQQHPRIGSTLSLAQFEAEAHAAISASGAAPRLIEQTLTRLGIQRRIALDIPSYIGAALVVEHTDLILTIPALLAQTLVGRGALRTLPVPFELPAYDVKLHWHERYHNDAGVRWLRRVIADISVADGLTAAAN